MSPLDPYALLGIGKTASDREVKAAHRKAIRRLHPDAGGGREEFERAQWAWELLSSPARRAHWDATGADIREQGAEALQAEVMGLLATIIMQVMQNDVDFNATDVRRLLMDLVRTEAQKMGDTRRRLVTAQGRNRTLQARFRSRAGKTGGLLSSVLAGHAQQISQQLAIVDHGIMVNREVASILEDHDYLVDVPPAGVSSYKMFTYKDFNDLVRPGES